MGRCFSGIVETKPFVDKIAIAEIGTNKDDACKYEERG
jgi:hypothetical protein